MISESETVCIIWRRFLPYHGARLRGASQQLQRRTLRVRGIVVTQGASVDAVPNVNSSVARGGTRTEQHITLFDQQYAHLATWQIWRQITAALDRIKPSAVAVNGWACTEAMAGLRWCRRHGRPAVLMSETMSEGASRRWWKESVKSRIVKRFDSALVSGKRQADYVARLGIARERIFIGYNAVDNAHFSRGAERSRKDARSLRERYGLPPRYFYANTRFLERKNVDGLIRAYAHYLREADSDAWRLVITGGGEREDHVRLLVRDLGLNDFVMLPGFVGYESLPAYYGLASAFVHAAKAEPWGLVVNEAAASGLPLLVARPVGAAYELLRDGENGYAFEPIDVTDMASCLSRLARLPEERRHQMGHRAQQIVQQYGPERFGAGLTAALEAAEARVS